MASIESFTAQRILELLDDTLAGASINGAGNLIVTTKGGVVKDLGPVMPAGASTQYYRGDKVWATLDKIAVGLNNVDNISVVSDYIPKWKSGVTYAVGQQVITPSGLIFAANVAHTSSSVSFVTDIDKWNGIGTDVPYGHMGRTAGFQALGGNNATVQMDIAQELRGGMTFDNPNDSLVIPVTGRYRAKTKGYFTGSTATVNSVRLYVNGVLGDGNLRGGVYEKLGISTEKNSSADIYIQASGIVPFNKGDKVALCQNSAVSCWGTNGFNGSGIEIEYVGGP